MEPKSLCQIFEKGGAFLQHMKQARATLTVKYSLLESWTKAIYLELAEMWCDEERRLEPTERSFIHICSQEITMCEKRHIESLRAEHTSFL